MGTADLPGPPVTEFVRSADGSPVIEASGEIDMDTGPQLRSVLYELIDADAGPVWVDMARVTFIDSSGLGVLVGALKRANARGGNVGVRNLTGSPRKVFEITGLLEIFEAT